MKNKGTALLLCCVVLLLCTTAMGFCQDNRYFLLTENGISNPTYSEYKKAPILKTGGDYYAMPKFATTFEKGTITAPTPFSEGVLCNGDTTTNYKRSPFPYAYWQGKSFASLFFDLKKTYFISKVRVKILFVPKVHGISKIGVYTWDEMLEAGSEPLKEITAPADGWNEFVIDKPSDKIKLDFTSLPGCSYMTVTEIEIWGKESSQPVKKAEAPKSAPQSSVPPRNYLAFDFGPINSPTWEGFTAVNENTVYAKERGYGWVPFKGGTSGIESNYSAVSTAVPGLFSRNRGKEIKVHDSFYGDFCAAERAYHSQVEQEFKVDLKNGKYLVYIGTGDIAYGRLGAKPFLIHAEDKCAVKSITYGPSLCAPVQFETGVKDGQLNLRFGDNTADQKNWIVSGILIFPCNNANEKATAQKIIAEFEKQIDAARIATHATAFNVKYNETTKLFPLAKTDTDRGYILFARDWMKLIYPNTVPQKAEADKDELSIWCSPGEYEPAAFGIYPLGKGLEAEIAVSDLVSKTNDKISKSNISIRVTGYLPERIKSETKTAGDYTYHRIEASKGTSFMEKVPKILWPYKGKISIDETKQIWLTAHVPKTAKPGKYEGTVAFKPSGKPKQILKFSLNVYPIDLKKSNRMEGMYWEYGTGNTIMYPENRKKELADMKEHGIRSVVLGDVTIPKLAAENGKLTVNFTALDTLFQEIKDAGMTEYIPFGTDTLEIELKKLCNAGAINMTFDDAYAYVTGEIYKHAKKKGWPEVLFYPVDEIANNAARREKLKHLVPLIRQTPGTKIFCTVNGYAAGVECADYVDYWCANIPMPNVQEQDVLNRGKVFMRYGNSFNYNPRISRISAGFGFWRRPATAMYYWYYQFINGDPLNGTDVMMRDWVASYPSPEGPINSIDFEAIREGIDDLNYIYTMQQLMDKAKKTGKGDLAKPGEAILEEITSCDPSSYLQSDLAGVPNEKCHEWRLRMAQEIMKLQAALR